MSSAEDKDDSNRDYSLQLSDLELAGNDFEPNILLQEPTICQCIHHPDDVDVKVPPRKEKLLSTFNRTQNYLQERRIPELIKYLMTMVLSNAPDKPAEYLEKVLNDCMVYRAGFGAPPRLFENKHLEAVVKSFDPGQRGWMSFGQVRRAFLTMGLPEPQIMENKMATAKVLEMLRQAQDDELFDILTSGMIESRLPSLSEIIH